MTESLCASLVLPSTRHCTVLAHGDAAGAQIELRRFDWDDVHEAVFAAPSSYLELTQIDGQARYLEARGKPLVPQGAIRWVPAERAFFCRWHSSRQTSLQCAMDIPRLTGESLVLPADRLPETFDLRDSTLHWLLTRMQDELTSPGLASSALLTSLSTAAAIALLRRFSTGVRASPSSGGRLGRRDLDELVMRLREDGLRPSLEALAAEQGLSARHYGRLFRQLAGQGFASFVAEQTTRLAQDLLSDPRRPVKEVALRCGFSDTAAFSKAFRKTTGQAPQAYRSLRHPIGR